MSALDFLSPGAAADAGSFHPVARSSMERRQRDAGATFEERDGWLLPVAIPGEAEAISAVGIADLSHLAKFEVRPNPWGGGGGAKPMGSDPLRGSDPAPSGSDAVVYSISPRRALVLCAPARAGAVRAELPGRVHDVTAGLGILVVAGPQAPTLMRRLTHLHHFPGGGSVAHVNAHVLVRGGAFWIVFPQELGHYLWEVAVDRAQPLGGGPVGVDALPAEARP